MEIAIPSLILIHQINCLLQIQNPTLKKNVKREKLMTIKDY